MVAVCVGDEGAWLCGVREIAAGDTDPPACAVSQERAASAAIAFSALFAVNAQAAVGTPA